MTPTNVYAPISIPKTPYSFALALVKAMTSLWSARSAA